VSLELVDGTHDFVVDAAETATFGLRTKAPSASRQKLLDP